MNVKSSKYKSVITLFAHEKARVLIETFPRSGSTLILSNLALANLKIRTKYGENNVNHMRDKLMPKQKLSKYLDSALLVRSPMTRLESFFLTKLVAGEPKSVMAIGELKYKKLEPLSIPIRKQLKGFFCCNKDKGLKDFICLKDFNSEVIQNLVDIKNFVLKLTFKDMINLFAELGFPNDSHVYPQSEMKTLRLAEYKNIFNLSKFNSFKNWYEYKTSEIFEFSFNQTQPNNRLGLKKFKAKYDMNVSELQYYLDRGLSPVEGSLLNQFTKQAIIQLYPFDYDIHLLSLKNTKFDGI